MVALVAMGRDVVTPGETWRRPRSVRIIAGSDHLGLADMIGFAAIHTVFFVLLALLYAGLRRGALEAAA